MADCDKDGSFNGKCCCNCRHQVQLMNHPWNKIAKGSIKELFAYGCANPMDFDRNKITVMESEHSMCEMYEPST